MCYCLELTRLQLLNQFSLSADAQYTLIAGGLQGIAKGTTYWDCCRPYCVLRQSYRKTTVRMCAADGVTTVPVGTLSGCMGGTGFACTDNAPWVKNSIGYGFIATGFATEERTSCKCFKLGLSNNKTMLVQATNIGSDLAGDRIDMMVCFLPQLNK